MATPGRARGRLDEVFLAQRCRGGRKRRIRIGRNVLTTQDLVRYSPRTKNDEFRFVCQVRPNHWCREPEPVTLVTVGVAFEAEAVAALDLLGMVAVAHSGHCVAASRERTSDTSGQRRRDLLDRPTVLRHYGGWRGVPAQPSIVITAAPCGCPV